MTEIDKWRQYSRMLNFPLPEEAEKDYLQDIALRSIYSNIGDELVFRGGTAISKVYSSGRFSEDLDFTVNSSYDGRVEDLIVRVETGIKEIGSYFQFSYSKKAYREMINYTVRIDGPLFLASSNESARQRIMIDLNTYERNLEKPRVYLRQTPYPNLPPYTLIVESENELLADKIKAAIERRHRHRTAFVRDIYDIWFLVTKFGLKQDFGLVSNKMRTYGKLEFSVKDLKACVDEAGKGWDDEMSTVLNVVPRYNDVRKALEPLLHVK
jgi:predicted nucleotidyltransferase component of viral defense system